MNSSFNFPDITSRGHLPLYAWGQKTGSAAAMHVRAISRSTMALKAPTAPHARCRHPLQRLERSESLNDPAILTAWRNRNGCSPRETPEFRDTQAPNRILRNFDVAKVDRKRKEFCDDFREGCPMLIGYARVSTDDQDLSQQRASLQAAGCRRIYEEKV